jgi:hypothetical protein
MQGTWYNPSTGDAFTVRDSFFEDNQYVVTTTDGRYLQYNQLQNYVQSDMKLEDLKKLNTNTKSKVNQVEALPAEVANLIDNTNDPISDSHVDDYFGILPEDMDMLTNPIATPKLGNIHATPTVTAPSVYARPLDVPIAEVNMNTAIIEKALKNTKQPDFILSLKWADYPEKQIEMLRDIMDIPADEIVEWYLDNIQFDEFVQIFKAAITEKIMKGSTVTRIETEPVLEASVVEVYTPVGVSTEPTEPVTTSKKMGGSKTIKAAKEAKEKKTSTSKK